MTYREILTELWAEALGLTKNEAGIKLAEYERLVPAPQDLDQDVSTEEEQNFRKGFWIELQSMEGQAISDTSAK